MTVQFPPDSFSGRSRASFLTWPSRTSAHGEAHVAQPSIRTKFRSLARVLASSVMIVTAAAPAAADPFFALYAEFRARISAEVGLDEPTRTMINGLPATIRKEAVVLVEESLKRLDASIVAHAKALDVALARYGEAVMCAIPAAAQDATESALVGAGIAERTSHQDLLDLRDRTEAALTVRSRPDDVIALRDDLAREAAILGCRYAVNKNETDRIFEQARGSYPLWSRLRSVGCRSARDCTETYRSVVASAIAEADTRDVQLIGAQAALERIAAPAPSAPGWMEALAPAKLATIEPSLQELYAIERGLRLAEASRLTRAINDLETANSNLRAAGRLHEGRSAKALAACNRDFERANDRLARVDRLAEQAVTLWTGPAVTAGAVADIRVIDEAARLKRAAAEIRETIGRAQCRRPVAVNDFCERAAPNGQCL